MRKQNKAWRKIANRLVLTVLLLSLIGTCLSVGLQLRRNRLDHALIDAIKEQEVQKAIELLDQGANANAVDRQDRPLTFQAVLADFQAKLQRKVPPKISANPPSALIVLCSRRSKGTRWTDP